MEIKHIYGLENALDIFNNQEAIKEHLKYEHIYSDYILSLVKDFSQKLPLNIDLFKSYNKGSDFNFTGINHFSDILDRHFSVIEPKIKSNNLKLINFTEHDFYNLLEKVKSNSKQELQIHLFKSLGKNFFTDKKKATINHSGYYGISDNFYIFREQELIGYFLVMPEIVENELIMSLVPRLHSNDSELIKLFIDVLKETNFNFERSIGIKSLGTTKENPNSIERDYRSVMLNELTYPDKNNYPTLNFDFQKYFTEFAESKANLLLLYGPPGTGKTTLLRELTKVETHTCVLAESNILRFSFEEIKRYLNRNDILIIEDADDYLGSRKDGNKVMSSLLNGLDGFIVDNGIKVVFNTNITNLSSIDEALIRPGRCFDVLHVPKLTPEQALKIATDNNIEIQDFNSKKDWSLAEVYNPPVKEYSNSRTKAIKLGF